jgi:hypothetical protein
MIEFYAGGSGEEPKESTYIYEAQLQRAREFLKSKGIHNPKPVLPVRKRRRKKN